MDKKHMVKTLLYHGMVILIGFIMIYPLLWMVLSSFKPSEEILRTAERLFPEEFRFENYANGWKGFGGYTFQTFFGNSIILSIVGTIGAVISSAVIGFGFARCEFKGKSVLFGAVLLSMMMPFQIIMIPQYILFNKMGWVGTYVPMLLPHFFGQGFFIFLIIQFIKGIPLDLDEAAEIDGCSIYGIFIRIVLPLVKPALVTTTIFSFMWKWDDFLGALLYLNKPQKYPVSLALKMFSDPSAQSDWGAMFAMATLSLLPIFLIFLTMQKYLVEGIASTGIKG